MTFPDASFGPRVLSAREILERSGVIPHRTAAASRDLLPPEVRLQAVVRGFLARRRFGRMYRDQLEALDAEHRRHEQQQTELGLCVVDQVMAARAWDDERQRKQIRKGRRERAAILLQRVWREYAFQKSLVDFDRVAQST